MEYLEPDIPGADELAGNIGFADGRGEDIIPAYFTQLFDAIVYIIGVRSVQAQPVGLQADDPCKASAFPLNDLSRKP